MMALDAEAAEGDLLRRMIAGDEQAFTALYRRWQGPLYRFALQMGGGPGLAEEITQETFITLLWKARSFDPSRGTLRGFLYGICRKHVLRYLEEEGQYVGLAKPSSGEETVPNEPTVAGDGLGEVIAAETVERVRGAVLTLPASYREAVVLCDLHEMSYAQAAEAIGCAVGTVRSRLHRGRELLLAKLSRAGARSPSLARR